MFQPRPYQTEAINKSVEFFKSPAKYNALVILPTGSGKSVVIANIAKELPGDTIVFQPSKEILEQNFRKFISYGYRAAIYSASAGKKHVGKTTFCMIGSVATKAHLFSSVKNIIIDECHLVNSEAGQYFEFISRLPGAKVLGLTATPYRMQSSRSEGTQLVFLNRSTPRIFNHVLYYIQNDVLFNSGHLAKLEYFSYNMVDRSRIKMLEDGSDFDPDSLKEYYQSIDMTSKIVQKANALLQVRKSLLVFCSYLSEAHEVSKRVPGSIVLSANTSAELREKIRMEFTTGKRRCVITVGIWTTGFDYPELDTVLMARSTMSLSLYYQMLGRVIRPHPSKKTGWFVDLGGNLNVFGKVETMKIQIDEYGLYSIWNNGRQLTNVSFTKN